MHPLCSRLRAQHPYCLWTLGLSSWVKDPPVKPFALPQWVATVRSKGQGFVSNVRITWRSQGAAAPVKSDYKHYSKSLGF